MATMADVARRARVSTATVSHVLNGTRPVAQETADRVRDAVALVDYRRDPIARALRTSRTDSIGVIVSDTGHPIFADMIHGIDEVAMAAGLTMLLTHSNEQEVRERTAIELLRDRRVDGLLIVPAAPLSTAALAEAVSAGMPIVAIDREVDLDIDHVGADAEPSLRLLTRHLLDHGHTKIGLVVGTTANGANIRRLEACLAELADAGLAPPSEWIVTADPDLDRLALIDATRAGVAELLGRADRPTALVSLNAEMTVATLEGADDARLRVPDDVAFVALDDLPWSQIVTPKITCASQPAAEIGRQAMHLLLGRIAAPDLAARRVRLECIIRHRQSCGCGPDLEIPIGLVAVGTPVNGTDGV
jgi:LacI family transcriptional regulator